jgi:hypothetical protein
MKIENLEQAAQYYAENRQLITGLDWEDEVPIDNFKTDFIEGAKWMQKNLFWEKDLVKAFNEGQAMGIRGILISGIDWLRNVGNKWFEKQDQVYKPTEDNYGTPPQGDDKIEFRTSLKSKDYFSGSGQK